MPMYTLRFWEGRSRPAYGWLALAALMASLRQNGWLNLAAKLCSTHYTNIPAAVAVKRDASHNGFIFSAK
jgi:hypothetical protein